MQRTSTLLACFFVACTLATNSSAEEGAGAGKYSFMLDGQPLKPEIVSLEGDSGNPREGDVLIVRNFWMVLGPPGAYRFTTDEEEGKRWRLYVEEAGARRPIAVKVGWTFPEREKVVVDTLAGLSEEQIKGLRGICLDEWPDGVLDRLAKVDFAHTCITVTDNTRQGKQALFPPLPAGIRYLNLDESSSEGIREFSALALQTELVFLRVRTLGRTPMPPAAIQASGLRVLLMDGHGGRDFAPLGRLKELRVLSLTWCRMLRTVGFAREMTGLLDLSISCTSVTDLGPLAELPRLRSVVANLAPIQVLPETGMPGLTRLEIFSTRLPAAAVEAFRKAHPECMVLHSWTEALQGALKGVTRIRVRSGGTCHRHLEDEKTLVDVTDHATVAQLIGNIRVDDSGSGFECMCCGNPTFEFYRGDELVASVGFHHGQSLRWSEGWPSDAMLTRDSARFLSDWLDENGVKGPKEDRNEADLQAKAAERVQARRRSLMPAGLDETLGSVGDFGVMGNKDALKAAQAAFESAIPDAASRAELYLRLSGCSEGTWNYVQSVDYLLEKKLLPSVGKEAFAAAIGKLIDDPWAVAGAGRWLFFNNKWQEMECPALRSLLPDLTARLLAHPRRANRARVIESLEAMGGPDAIAAFRRVLADEIRLRALPEDERWEPGESVSREEGDDTAEVRSDMARCALALARLGDKDSLPRIRELLGKATERDREQLEKAVDLLSK